MELKDFLNIYKTHPNLQTLVEWTQKQENPKIRLKGLTGSSKSMFCSQFLKQSSSSHLFIHNDKEEAAYFHNDLANILGEESVSFFPASFKRSVLYNQPDHSNIILRTEIMNALCTGKRKMILVTYPEALAEKVINRKKLREKTFMLEINREITIEEVEETLRQYDFQRVDFVYEPGQYSIRGSIVDIFSFSYEQPYRIDFFGNEIDTIRTFDVENQLSIQSLETIRIVPNVQDLHPEEVTDSLMSFLPKGTTVWSRDMNYAREKMNDLFKQVSEKDNSDNESIKKIITGDYLYEECRDFTVIEFGHYFSFPSENELHFQTSSQPSFNKNFDILYRDLSGKSKEGYRNIILSGSRKQIDRLEAIFAGINSDRHFDPLLMVLHEGFIDNDLKICAYTDHQIFERYHKFRLRGNFTRSEALTVREFTGLKPGDYVVHIDHGIARFGGLERIEVNGKTQEALKLVFKDNDTLYVKIHALHRISKYRGKDDKPPKIYKLGTGAWQKLKQRTKKKVKDIAKDLIALYAQRKQEKGFAFSPDSYLQKELEASFIYEDTPDQEEATMATKKGMENTAPMDRLICGDVGFGKTEIAIRAAFKAVADSKQVAILVPTTILALQHYQTFTDRLKDFPCTIEYLTRLKNPSEQKRIISELPEGKPDIIIGTHKLVSKNIKFKDLGLLIIDEEQKFGVAIKEKLKNLKTNVDTLTLTATPIPRTLQFSLMGARDLSIINTPPPNRHPIITELHGFNEEIIKEGINYEVSRNGQVFFIHNRIDNIRKIEALINRICPKVKTAIVHGQMEGRKLENVMLDFIHGDYDVLIATTIIESGLDIPNANTMFINNANNFGLSDLHQLRGRVGRSNKKAFCYLLAPPLSVVTPEARRRLKAIEEFSELGSGFNIAMQDLDIRGAGNLLGAEQSGFIADIGFETYHRILDEAVNELKETDFKNLFEEEKSQESGKVTEAKKKKFVKDCHIDTDLEIMYPDDYIPNIAERIRLYRELNNISTEQNLEQFESSLKDRFGLLPEPAVELLNIVRLRWLAEELGFEKIFLQNKKMVIHFISDPESPYFKSPLFMNILQFVQNNPQQFIMKEKADKLTLTMLRVSNIRQAIGLLEGISG